MTRYRPPRNVFLIGLTSFFNDMSSEMVLSIFPAFFTSVLKAGAGSLGLVIIKIYAGKYSDKIKKRKPFMIFGYGLSVATRPMYLLVSSVGGVIGIRVTDRIGKGLREAPRDAIISLSTPKEEMGRAFGFHRMMDTLGAILGPLIAYLILRAYPEGFNIVFVVAFIVGILAVASILFVKDIAGEARKGNLSLDSISVFPSDFKRYLVALFLLSAGSIPVAVLLLKTQHLGFSLASIPLFYMLYSLSYAGFSVSAGGMSDRIGARTVMRIGYVVLLAITLALGFLLLGLFPALTDGVARALAAELSPEDHRAGAYGLVNATAGFGLMFAGIAGGYIWEHFGANYALFAGGVVVVLGIAVLSTIIANGKENLGE
ncbi:MAG: Major facilitator superfamily [Candidatus Nomurabacteria bacterium GW2011_GWB1_44_12]|uniref:Major facilitator superfamily n=1 Tax=Candidatus Nomurabacteria bacterium GW2011_GWB1_44_12 TaxID=1618748 RepID=A0A837IC68_9BACT|nr:MAG: Major facilitator superfamily [Candidatus Nomurabacteria bacterium GW2011_GWB1_44_12]